MSELEQPMDEMLYDLHLRVCDITDPGGETQEWCNEHKHRLTSAIQAWSLKQRIADLEALEQIGNEWDDFYGQRYFDYVLIPRIDQLKAELKEMAGD